MAGKILEFCKKVESSQENLSVHEKIGLPREYPTARVLDAVKYYILVQRSQPKAMQLVKYLVQTPLTQYTLATPDVAQLIEAADRKKVLIAEMGGEV